MKTETDPIGEELNFCRATLLKSLSTKAFSCKFAAYFQNTFSMEHLWVAASEG